MTTNTETQAAAERLLKPYEQVERPWKDGQVVARAYLRAQHPADDDVPVDEEWLQAVGFLKGRQRLHWETRHGDWYWELGPVRCWPKQNKWMVGGTVVKRQTIRGDVRLLCRALGVELKEGDSK